MPGKFDRCVKAVRKTVKARRGSTKEGAAIAICTKTVLHPRGRTLKRYRRGRLVTQRRLRGGVRVTWAQVADEAEAALDAAVSEDARPLVARTFAGTIPDMDIQPTADDREAFARIFRMALNARTLKLAREAYAKGADFRIPALQTEVAEELRVSKPKEDDTQENKEYRQFLENLRALSNVAPNDTTTSSLDATEGGRRRKFS